MQNEFIFITAATAATTTVAATSVASFFAWLGGLWTTTKNTLKDIFTNPAVLFLTAAIILTIFIWIPYSHIVLQIAQSIYTPFYRSLLANFILPVLRPFVGPVTQLIRWWNVGWMVIQNVITSFVITTYKCKAFGSLFSVVAGALQPLGYSIIVFLKIFGTLVQGKPIVQTDCVLGTALLCNATSRITAEFSGVASCYCALILTYPFNAATLILNDVNFRCSVGNALAVVTELISEYMNTIYKLLQWAIAVLEWFVEIIFHTYTTPHRPVFPMFNTSRILFSGKPVNDYLAASACCCGDFVDDMINSLLYLIVDTAHRVQQSGNSTVAWNMTTPFPVNETVFKPFKIGGLIRATIPPISDIFYLLWKFSIDLTSFGWKSSARNFNENRFFDDIETICVEAANTTYSLGNGVEGIINNLFHKDVTIYGPGLVTVPVKGMSVFLNHTCRSLVYIMRDTVHLIRDLPTYAQYKVGRYWDCTIATLYQTGDESKRVFNDFFQAIPDIWINYPHISWNSSSSLLGDSVGTMVASIPRTVGALINYVITISERSYRTTDPITHQSLSGFTNARHVPSDDFFEEIQTGIYAYKRFTSGILNLIPGETWNIRIPHTHIMFGYNDFAPLIRELFTSIPLLVPMFTTGPVSFVASLIQPTGSLAVVMVVMSNIMIDFANLAVQFLQLLMRLFHHGSFDKHWRFNRADIESFARREYEFADDVSETFIKPLCVFYNQMQAVGNRSCLYELNLGGPRGSGICPLKLLPCPDVYVRSSFHAFFRTINLLIEIPFYPRDVARVLYDRTLCELETAMMGLNQTLDGFNNITIDISKWWGTSRQINLATGISYLMYGLVKCVTALNSMLVELLMLMLEGKYAQFETGHALVCNKTNPIYVPGLYPRCDPCNAPWMNDTNVSATVCANTLGDSELQCCNSGKCSLYCAVKSRPLDDFNHASSALKQGIEHATNYLGLVDPLFQTASQNFTMTFVWAMRTFFVAAAGKLNGESDAFSQAFGNVPCIMDSAVTAFAYSASTSISLIGRVILFIGNLVEPNNNDTTSDHVAAGFFNLSVATAETIKSLATLIIEPTSTILRVFGAIVGGEFSSDVWTNILLDGVCTLDSKLTYLRINFRDFVTAIDISGNAIFCEAADLLETVLAFVTTALSQFMHFFVAVIDPSYDLRFSFDELIIAMRRFCIAVGNFVSGTIYTIVHLVFPHPMANFKTILDGIGGFIGMTLNLAVAVVDSALKLALMLIAPVIRAIGFDISFYIVGEADTAWDIVRVLGIALTSWLDALASVFDTFLGIVGTVIRLLSKVIKLFIADNSPIAEVVNGAMRLILAFINFILSIFIGNFGTAAKEFFDALIDFMGNIIDTIFNLLIMFVDTVIFGGLKIEGDYGPIECLIHIGACIAGIFGFRDAVPEHIQIANHLHTMAMMFTVNDTCQDLLEQVSNGFRRVNESKCNVSALGMDCIPGLRGMWRTYVKWQTVLCIRQFAEILNTQKSEENARQQAREAREEEEMSAMWVNESTVESASAWPEESSTSEQEYTFPLNMHCTTEAYWDGTNSDPLCVAEKVGDTVDIVTGITKAVVFAMMNTTAENRTSYEAELTNAGVRPEYIEFFDKALLSGASDTSAATSKLRTGLYKFAFGESKNADDAVSILEQSTNIMSEVVKTILNNITVDPSNPNATNILGRSHSSFSRRQWSNLSYSEKVDRLMRANSLEDYVQRKYNRILTFAMDRHLRLSIAKELEYTDHPERRPNTSNNEERWEGDKTVPRFCGHNMKDWSQYTIVGADDPFIDSKLGIYSYDTGGYSIPADETCPDWCPDCFNPNKISTIVEYPCSYKSCADYEDFPYLTRTQELCGRICGAAINSRMFKNLCVKDKYFTYPNGDDYFYFNQYTPAPVLRAYPGLTREAISISLMKDVKGLVGPPLSTPGIWTPGMVNGYIPVPLEWPCNVMGHTGRPPDGFCELKCDPHSGLIADIAQKVAYFYNPLSYYDPHIYFTTVTPSFVGPHFDANITNDALTNTVYHTAGPAAWMKFMIDMCSAFCYPFDNNCETMKTSQSCTDSVASGMTCLATCDIDWTTSGYTQMNLPDTCYAQSSLICDPLSNVDGSASSCVCAENRSPPGTGNCTTYSCQYNFGQHKAYHSNSRPFFCPIQDSFYYYFDVDMNQTIINGDGIRPPPSSYEDVPNVHPVRQEYINAVGSVMSDQVIVSYVRTEFHCISIDKYVISDETLSDETLIDGGITPGLSVSEIVNQGTWNWHCDSNYSNYVIGSWNDSFTYSNLLEVPVDSFIPWSGFPEIIYDYDVISASGIWHLSNRPNRCPPEVTTVISSSSYCNTAYCTVNSTYDNPVPLPGQSCIPDLDCYKTTGLDCSCIGTTFATMYLNLSGTLFSGYARTWIKDDATTFGSTRSDGKLIYMLPLPIGEASCASFLSHTNLSRLTTSYPEPHYVNTSVTTCAIQPSYPELIRNIANSGNTNILFSLNGSITMSLQKFINLFTVDLAGDVDTVHNTVNFTNPNANITVRSQCQVSGDICDMMCGHDDPWCLNLTAVVNGTYDTCTPLPANVTSCPSGGHRVLQNIYDCYVMNPNITFACNTSDGFHTLNESSTCCRFNYSCCITHSYPILTGLNCSLYRTARPLYGMAAARRWFCEQLPNTVSVLTSSMFPISGAGANALAAGAKTIFPTMHAVGCPTYSGGSVGNFIDYSLGAVLPQLTYYKQDACVMRAPAKPASANLNKDQCNKVSNYGAVLDDIHSWVANGLPIPRPEYFPTRGYKKEEKEKIARQTTRTEKIAAFKSEMSSTEDPAYELMIKAILAAREERLNKKSTPFSEFKLFYDVQKKARIQREQREQREQRDPRLLLPRQDEEELPQCGAEYQGACEGHCHVCEIPYEAPVACDRYPYPELAPVEHLPNRTCWYTPTYCCDRIWYLKNVTTDPVGDFLRLGYLDLEGRNSRSAGPPSPYDELMAKVTTMREMLKFLAANAKPKRRTAAAWAATSSSGSHRPVKSYVDASNRVRYPTPPDQLASSEVQLINDIWMNLGLRLELAACAAEPGSAPCRRLDDAMVETVKRQRARGIATPPLRHFSDILKGEMRLHGGSGSDRAHTIGESFMGTRWLKVLPSIYDMRRDCYFLCTFNWLGLLADSCLWDATPVDGPVMDVIDALLTLRDGVCDAIGSGDSSQYFNNGSDTLSVDIHDMIVLKKAKITVTGLWGLIVSPSTSEIAVIGDVWRTILKIFSWLVSRIFGAGAGGASFLQSIARTVLRLNSTANVEDSIVSWAMNLNLRYGNPDGVGLLYWATFPFFVDCFKLNGTFKILGIPLYSPFWFPKLPTWLPRFIYNVLNDTVKPDFLVPDSLIIDEGGCSRAILSIPTLPFLYPSACRPEFANCAEKFGFSSPFDSAYFLLDWLFPKVAHSTFVKVVATLTLTRSNYNKFSNFTSVPNKNDYIFCFFVTSPLLLAFAVFIVILEYTASTLVALGSVLFTMVGSGGAMLFAFVLYLWAETIATAMHHGQAMQAALDEHGDGDDGGGGASDGRASDGRGGNGSDSSYDGGGGGSGSEGVTAPANVGSRMEEGREGLGDVNNTRSITSEPHVVTPATENEYYKYQRLRRGYSFLHPS